MQTEEWKNNWKRPLIEHNKLTQWNWMVAHPENLKMGSCVDIGAFTYIDALNGVLLDDDVQIGSHCAIYTHSTIDDVQGPVVILKGAAVGSHSTVLPGVTIGEGTIVGANSLVKYSIPPRCVAYGVPAKPMRRL